MWFSSDGGLVFRQMILTPDVTRIPDTVFRAPTWLELRQWLELRWWFVKYWFDSDGDFLILIVTRTRQFRLRKIRIPVLFSQHCIPTRKTLFRFRQHCSDSDSIPIQLCLRRTATPVTTLTLIRGWRCDSILSRVRWWLNYGNGWRNSGSDEVPVRSLDPEFEQRLLEIARSALFDNFVICFNNGAARLKRSAAGLAWRWRYDTVRCFVLQRRQLLSRGAFKFVDATHWSDWFRFEVMILTSQLTSADDKVVSNTDSIWYNAGTFSVSWPRSNVSAGNSSMSSLRWW